MHCFPFLVTHCCLGRLLVSDPHVVSGTSRHKPVISGLVVDMFHNIIHLNLILLSITVIYVSIILTLTLLSIIL